MGIGLETVEEVTAAATATSVIKGEAGLSRLLLSMDVLHYSIYALVLESHRQSIGKDIRFDLGHGAAEEYARLVWRRRNAKKTFKEKMNYAIRNFDFADMNSQHSGLVMTLFNLSLAQGQLKTDEESRPAMIAQDMTVWLAKAASRTTIRWTRESGADEDMAGWAMSSLMSGSRGKAETNTGENIGYSEQASDSIEQIHGAQVLIDEEGKGDDEE